MAIGYVNAGGRGTRLNGIFTPNPETGIAKGLLEIGDPGVRLVDHHIANLRSYDVEDIVIATGDQAELYEYIQDIYIDDDSVKATKSIGQLGTGGDLVRYVHFSGTDSEIIVQNVDTILDIDLHDFSREFCLQRKIGGIATIALTLNSGVPNEGAFFVDEANRVVFSAECGGAPTSDQSFLYQASSTGAVVIDPDFLRKQNWREQDGMLSIYRDILCQAQEEYGLYSYNNQYRFFRDVGTIGTWLASEGDEELQRLLCYNSHNQ